MRNLQKLKLAWEAYKYGLNGVFCIYKRTGMRMRECATVLKYNLAKDLNDMPMLREELKQMKRLEQLASGESKSRLPAVSSAGHLATPSDRESPHYSSGHFDTKQLPINYKLVYGDVFITDDFDITYLHGLNKRSSGVVLMSVGPGRMELDAVAQAKLLRVYHVKARLGYATDNFFTDGKFIERSTYRHVTIGKMEKVCSAAQSGHQRLMYQSARVDPHSQEAYELACSGIIRPATLDTAPILYGIKCIYFNPPEFTLEIHALNENCFYLAELVNDIGLQLHTNAVCSHIHRIRHGYYDLQDTILFRNWRLQPIMKNIQHCSQHITPQKMLPDVLLKPEGSNLDSTSSSGLELLPGETFGTREIIQMSGISKRHRLPSQIPKPDT